MPDQHQPDNSHDTRSKPPLVPPELPDEQATRLQRETDRTRAMPPAPPPRPATLPEPAVHAAEKPKHGHPPPRPRSSSGFTLPLWSIGLMLLSVAGLVTCFALLVLSLGGRQIAPTSQPRFVILTAEPTFPAQQTLPVVLVSPTLPPGFGPGFQGTVPAFALQGPNLEPVILTDTPTPRPAIQIGSIVEVVSSTGARIRQTPGTNDAVNTIRRIANRGEQFIVVDGPQVVNDLTWWQVQDSSGATAGWVAENDRATTLIAAVSP